MYLAPAITRARYSALNCGTLPIVPRGNLCDKIDDAHQRRNWPTRLCYPKLPGEKQKTGTVVKIHTQERIRALKYVPGIEYVFEYVYMAETLEAAEA